MLPLGAVIAAVLLAGCGGNDAEPTAMVPDLRHTECLKRIGVHFAGDRAELAFFFSDGARDDAEHPGFAAVEDYSIVVDEWRSVSNEDQPLEWALWAAQPPARDLTVSELLSLRPSRSYVAYLRNPTERQLREVDRCLTPSRAEEERARKRLRESP